jgi:hypothetical protein
LPNGAQVTHSYDAGNNLTGIINAKASGELVSRFTYTYDNVGNLKPESGTLRSAATLNNRKKLTCTRTNPIQSTGARHWTLPIRPRQSTNIPVQQQTYA